MPVRPEFVNEYGINMGEWIIGYGHGRLNFADSRLLPASGLDPGSPGIAAPQFEPRCGAEFRRLQGRSVTTRTLRPGRAA